MATFAMRDDDSTAAPATAAEVAEPPPIQRDAPGAELMACLRVSGPASADASADDGETGDGKAAFTGAMSPRAKTFDSSEGPRPSPWSPVLRHAEGPRSSRTLSWDRRFGPILIGVGGASGSGKTTMCERIQQYLSKEKVVIVSLDSYYAGLPEEYKDKPSEYNFDDPKALDFELLFNHIGSLKRGASEIEVPHYDFTTHNRGPPGTGTVVKDVDVIIFEGLFTLHNAQIRDMLDLCLFAVEDADTCLVRRLRRDIAERGRDVRSVLAQYEKFVKPGFQAFIEPSMIHADIIVPRAGRNVRLIKLIVNNIMKKLHPERPAPSPTSFFGH